MRGASIAEKSLIALNDQTNTGEASIQAAAYQLAESLGSYGFKGRLEFELTVTIIDKTLGSDKAVAKRSITLQFNGD